MFSFLTEILQKNALDLFAPIPLSACRLQKPYLLERAGIQDGTVIMLAVPYYTEACTEQTRNLSAYAVSHDYHTFFEMLFESILPRLCVQFPMHRFVGFADHSPIAEVEAAARAGLGVIGKNGLLLTQKYSSYIFLGEIVTDAHIPCQTHEITYCSSCGACTSACPAKACGGCLSALTQKKGELTAAEAKALVHYGSAWGCDICQEVCPYTVRALQSGTIFTQIPYFTEAPIAHLTTEVLDAMSDAEFCKRAFAWRGRTVVRRNLLLLESHSKKGEYQC